MPFVYQSGEQIKQGDRVLLRGEPGEVEFIADPDENPDDWHVKEFGGGVMIIEPRRFGRLFLTQRDINNHEDLRFISRLVV